MYHRFSLKATIASLETEERDLFAIAGRIGPRCSTLINVVRSRGHKTLSREHGCEFRIGALSSRCTVIGELEMLAIVDDLNPEAVLAGALIRGVKFYLQVGCKRKGKRHLVIGKTASRCRTEENLVVSIKEKKRLRHRPIVGRVCEELDFWSV